MENRVTRDTPQTRPEYHVTVTRPKHRVPRPPPTSSLTYIPRTKCTDDDAHHDTRRRVKQRARQDRYAIHSDHGSDREDLGLGEFTNFEIRRIGYLPQPFFAVLLPD